jgi:hypothetical protein
MRGRRPGGPALTALTMSAAWVRLGVAIPGRKELADREFADYGERMSAIAPEIRRAFASLLRADFVTCPDADVIEPLDDPVYMADIAEPWFAAMHAVAVDLEVTITTYIGYDPMVTYMGSACAMRVVSDRSRDELLAAFLAKHGAPEAAR